MLSVSAAPRKKITTSVSPRGAACAGANASLGNEAGQATAPASTAADCRNWRLVFVSVTAAFLFSLSATGRPARLAGRPPGWRALLLPVPRPPAAFSKDHLVRLPAWAAPTAAWTTRRPWSPAPRRRPPAQRRPRPLSPHAPTPEQIATEAIGCPSRAHHGRGSHRGWARQNRPGPFFVNTRVGPGRDRSRYPTGVGPRRRS